MIYTSGSTGKPKGAMITHNGAVNHILAEFEAMAFHENTAFLQSAPTSSDISVWQFLAPLLKGGCTVIADLEILGNPSKLFDYLKNQQVTLFEFVPALLEIFIGHLESLSDARRALPDLEWVMVTGEAVSVKLINRWLKAMPSVPIVNAYGPTEAADDVSQEVFRELLPENQINVPIGKSIAGLTLYVLDDHLNLSGIGVPGEICVAGTSVGKGYWRNSEKTRQVFVDNPFSESFTRAEK